MKVNLLIRLVDSIEEFEEKYNLIANDDNYTIIVDLLPGENLDSVLTDYESIRVSFKNNYDFCIDYIESGKGYEIFMNMSNDELKEVFDHIKEVSLEGSFEHMPDFIKTYDLSFERITLSECFEINDDTYLYFLEYFKDQKNIYLKLDGNDELITIDKYLKTYELIENMVNEVKSMNFSPIEEIMYVYDMVRDRVYVSEDNNEEQYISRDLTSVLLGDKIVCLGFANIFDCVLRKLGYKTKICELQRIDNPKIGHARNIVNIKDDKYKIDGIYYFDPTWDCRKFENDYTFLDKYRYFAKTKSQMDKLNKGVYNELTLPNLEEEDIWIFDAIVTEDGINKVSREVVDKFNKLSRFILGKTLIDIILVSDMYDKLPESYKKYNHDSVIDKLEIILEKLDCKLDANKLLKVLFEVRKKQYYNNPEKYKFSIGELYNILNNSGWYFQSERCSLFSELMGETIVEDPDKSFKKIKDDEEWEKKIGQIKIVKTLKKILNNKVDESK